MGTNYNSYDIDYSQADDMDNIIRINNSDADNDEQDYDFDYDPNEMYFALLNDDDNNY